MEKKREMKEKESLCKEVEEQRVKDLAKECVLE
jgi:hypothetical protein